MGTYVDPGNERFREVRNSRFFVDKSGLINQTNSVLGTWDCQILVSRPEGFGKSTAIAMLEAYYSFGCESLELFQGLEFEKDPSFEEHLNRHHVISADIGKLYEAAR